MKQPNETDRQFYLRSAAEASREAQHMPQCPAREALLEAVHHFVEAAADLPEEEARHRTAIHHGKTRGAKWAIAS